MNVGIKNGKMFIKKILTSLLLTCGLSIHAMESFDDNKKNSMQQQETKFVTLNESLLLVASAMQNLGYQAKLVKVESLVTDDNGNLITDKNNNVKKEPKDAVSLSKDNVTMAVFTLDGTAPADHNLYEWSGCGADDKNVENDIINFYLDLIGFNNYKYDDEDKINIRYPGEMSNEVVSLISVPNPSDRKFFENLLRQILSYPEGKMLIYSMFLNQSSIIGFDIKKPWNSPDYKHIKKTVKEFSKIYKMFNDPNNVALLKDYYSLVVSMKIAKEYSTLSWNVYCPTKSLDLYSKGTQSTFFEPNSELICLNETECTSKTNTFYHDTFNYFSDDYSQAFLVGKVNKRYNNVLSLFHEMVHALTLIGRNKKLHEAQYPSQKVDRIETSENGRLIVKYWKDFFNIPTDNKFGAHKYSKNEVKMLLNDYFKFNNFDEVLAICWNNRGKEYFGNHIHTNLLMYRVLGRTWNTHMDIVPAQVTGGLKYSAEFELTTDYENILWRNCFNQQCVFKKSAVNLKNKLIPIKYPLSDVTNNKQPFEITGNSGLLFNSPGYSYKFNDVIIYDGKLNKRHISLFTNIDLDAEREVKNTKQSKYYTKRPTLVNLYKDGTAMQTINYCQNLYNLFVAYNYIDKDNKNTYTETELITLINNIMLEVKKKQDLTNKDLKPQSDDPEIRKILDKKSKVSSEFSWSPLSKILDQLKIINNNINGLEWEILRLNIEIGIINEQIQLSENNNSIDESEELKKSDDLKKSKELEIRKAKERLKIENRNKIVWIKRKNRYMIDFIEDYICKILNKDSM